MLSGERKADIIGQEWVVLGENPDGTRLGVPILYELGPRGFTYHFQGKSPDTVGVWVYPSRIPGGIADWPYTRPGVQEAMGHAYAEVCRHWGLEDPARVMTKTIPLLEEIEPEGIMPAVLITDRPEALGEFSYERLDADTSCLREHLDKKDIAAATEVYGVIHGYLPSKAFLGNEVGVRFSRTMRDLALEGTRELVRRAKDAQKAGNPEALVKSLENIEHAIEGIDAGIEYAELVEQEFQKIRHIYSELEHIIDLLGGSTRYVE